MPVYVANYILLHLQQKVRAIECQCAPCYILTSFNIWANNLSYSFVYEIYRHLDTSREALAGKKTAR